MNGKGLDRRTLLKAAVALPLVLLRPQWLPELRAAEKNGAGAGAGNREGLLLLVELHGGNDGLNTLIPYAEAAYYQARPQLAISRDQVRQLTPQFGLHPALASLMPFWEQGAGLPAWGRVSPTESFPFPIHRDLGDGVRQ